MSSSARLDSYAPNFTQIWRRLFRRDSERARASFARLSEIWNAQDAKATASFRFWLNVRQTASNGASDSYKLQESAAESFFDDSDRSNSDVFSFALQTCLAQTILTLTESAFELTSEETRRLFGATPFDWGESIRPLLNVDRAKLESSESNRPNGGDPFGETYSSVFSNDSRKSLGEFYTPPALADYLCERALEFQGVEPGVLPEVLDPTCGSGVFLVATLRRLLARGVDPVDALGALSGYDLSPLAVLTSRVNLLFAATSRASEQERPEEARRIIRRRGENSNESILPVYLFDALQNCVPSADANLPDYFDSQRWASRGASRRFDLVLGNPPWIAWDKLSVEYREATKDYWRRYGLFTLSSKEARYGGGKKELAGLMLYASVDLRLKSSGVLAFVLPKTLFQTQKSGDGFRRFGASESGDLNERVEPFRALALDDFSELTLFRGVASKVAAFCVRKGEATRYPIPTRRWRARKGRRYVDEAFEARSFDEGVARPLNDKIGAPLLFEFEKEPTQKFSSASKKIDASRRNDPEKERCDALVERLFEKAERRGVERRYVAQLGANAAGGSGVFWFQDVGSLESPLVSVRNLGDVGRRKVETLDATIESAALFPLLRWRDVDEFVARPTSALILIPQDPKMRRGYELERMKRDFPNALEYLTRFETFLRERAAYKRYQNNAPFWSLYNVDVATFARYKVVWRRMDSTLRAAVVQWDDERARPVIPQETLSTVAVESLEEADYLAAILNSSPARKRIESVSVASSKGFGSPGVLNAVPIPRFDPCDETSLKLSEFGRTKRLEVGDASTLEIYSSDLTFSRRLG